MLPWSSVLPVVPARACNDGRARVSFIELGGNLNERFDHAIGIRTLDRSVSVLWEAPDVYAGVSTLGGPISFRGSVSQTTAIVLR